MANNEQSFHAVKPTSLEEARRRQRDADTETEAEMELEAESPESPGSSPDKLKVVARAVLLYL